MRVIAGKYKKRQLKVPKTQLTRPTTDKNKENLFNMIGPYFEGGTVLDLFGGSGGLGIEAISRGCDTLYSVDKQYEAFKTIKENFALLQLENCYPLKMDYKKALNYLKEKEIKFDYVFLDPPYGKGLVDDILFFLVENQMLNDEACIVVEELKEKNLLKESEGAMIVDLDEYDMAPCLVMKKDGSSIYATRDLAAIFYRKKEYNFDKCIYVTGLEQKLHFAQVFKVVELMGYEWAKENLIHVPYGLVSLEGGKLSTRSGNIVYAEDILKESVSKIREIIAEKNPDLKDKEDVAQKVGIGAIIFNDLYNQRIKDVTFTWEKIHSFDGETGPYVQYTYARAASVLRKTGITEVGEIDPSLVTDETSVALLKEIERFPEVIKVAADRLEPSVISRYVMGVAQSFNRFYHENQCNVEDQKLKEARVKIVILAKQVIKDGLDLLGIQCPEQM